MHPCVPTMSLATPLGPRHSFGHTRSMADGSPLRRRHWHVGVFRPPARRRRRAGLVGDVGPGIGVGLHRHKPAIVIAVDRLEETLSPGAFPNRLAHGFDRTLQRCIADELLRPDLFAQLLLGDDSVGCASR
jgi:hypothetical protein